MRAATSHRPLSSRVSRRDVLRLGTATLGTAAVGGASGCGGGRGGQRSDTLTMWAWSGADILQAGFRAVQKTYPAEFGHVKLATNIYSGGDPEVAQQFTLQLAAREPLPDIVMLNYLEVPEMAAAGVLADLSKILDPVEDDLYKGAHAVTSYRGQKIAAPYELKSKLFFYRDDLFRAASIDPRAIRSVADFISAGKRFHQKFPDRYMIGTGPTPDSSQTGEILSAFPDARFADRAGNYELTTNPCFAKTLEFQKQLLDEGIGYSSAPFSADWPAAIKDGRICGFLSAQWMKEFLPQYGGPKQAGLWKAILWPTLEPLPDQRYGSDEGGGVWVVPAGAANRDLAIRYLQRALLDRKSAIPFFAATGQAPLLRSARDETINYIRRQQRPAGVSKATWLQSPQNFLGADYFSTEFASYDYVKSFEFDPNAILEYDIFSNAAADAYSGRTSISSALKSAQSAMVNQVGDPYLA